VIHRPTVIVLFLDLSATTAVERLISLPAPSFTRANARRQPVQLGTD